jgi:ribosomal 50S subunit-recycling heat shock protein
MRLDKYLKVSRIVKRRTVANEVCDAGRVSANGRPVKASYTVAVGDVIELTMGAGTTKIKVLSVEEKTGKELAREMYRVIED